MALEYDRPVHPRTDGKGVAGIAEQQSRMIADVIARRKTRAAVRAGYIALGIRVVTLALAVWLIFTYAFLITQVSGQGMFPALKDGDLAVVFRRQTALLMGETYQKYDIVVYRVGNTRRFGRVAAIAGDQVEIARKGGLTVNGVGQSGEIMFPTLPRNDSAYRLTVPENTLFVLGDRRTDTVDSRDDGPIPIDSVEGKVISILRRRGL